MCRARFIVALLAAGCGGVALAAPPESDKDCTSAELVLPGNVVRVLDGDTADVLLQGDAEPTRIRFYGIDAPEKSQPLGKKARDTLTRAIKGRSVALIPTEQRTYDRIVGTLCLGDTSVSREMVRLGYAWAYRQYLGGEQGDEVFCRLEAQARARHLGVWSLPSAERLAPWEYRHSKRERGSTPSDYSAETAEKCIAAFGKKPQSGKGATSPATGAQMGHTNGCEIKGNINSKGERIYHMLGSQGYAQTVIDGTKGERWFCSKEEARAAGWRASP